MSVQSTAGADNEVGAVPFIEAKALDLSERVDKLLAVHRRRSGSEGDDTSGVVRAH